jgi:hypothetical protein
MGEKINYSILRNYMSVKVSPQFWLFFIYIENQKYGGRNLIIFILKI